MAAPVTASATAVSRASALVNARALLLLGGANLVPDPSFEYDATGSPPAVAWSNGTPAYWLSPGSSLNVVGTAPLVQGSHLLNVLAITGALYQGVTTLLSGTFRAGVTYTASVYMYGLSGGEQVLLDIGAAPTESPDGAVDFSEQAITLTTGWTRYSVTWTPRVNQPVARLILRSATATVMTFRVDGALVTPGSVAPAYFDGDTPGCRWSGTPGNSASTGPVSTAVGRATMFIGTPWWVVPRAAAVSAARVNLGTPLPSLDPLAVFAAPPALDPPDLVSDLPPFEQSSYEVQAVLGVIANELARLDAARLALIQNFFPLTADALLPLFEQLLGLPVNPPASLDLRHQLVAAYMQRLKSEGRGLDWTAAITAAVGTINWNYLEHDPANPASPVAYTVNVNIPQVSAGIAWPLIRDITPAHVAIVEGYTGGFLVGVTPVWPGGAGNNL